MKSSLLRLAMLSLALFGVEAWAQAACTSASGSAGASGYCNTQPDSYGITVYKAGLCTSAPTAPTAGTTAGLFSCSTVFENTSGSAVTITPSGSTALSGTFTRPPNGTYTHGYLVIGTSFSINTAFTFDASRTAVGGSGGSGTKCWTKSGTFYSWGGTATFECGNAVANQGAVISIMNAFGGSGANYSASETFTSPGGASVTMSAYLVKSDLSLGTSASSGSAGDVARLLGITTLSATVSDATTGMNLAFKASQGGTIAYGYDSNGGTADINGIYGGPFQVVLTLQ